MNLSGLYDILFSGKKVVVITGAGISTLSGIPDFRGRNGLYSKNVNGAYMLSRDCLKNEPEEFYDFYKRNLLTEKVEPNIVHRVLARLEEKGFIDSIITQNIDGLHQKAGSKNVIELHGNGERFYCQECHENYSKEEYLESCTCKKCGGIVRPDIVLYQESVDKQVNNEAVKKMFTADKVIVLGSSLSVWTIIRLLNTFIRNKIGFTRNDIFIVNADETPYDNYARTCSDDLKDVFEAISQEEAKKLIK